VQVRKTARFVIVEFGSESEWDGEDDGNGWMASLMPLRSDLLRGDLRCLYLGWLRCAQDDGPGEVKLEPPVPAGLKGLSGPLYALIEFLEIDEDLVEAAAQAQNRSPLDRPAENCPHGFAVCRKKTRTSCSSLRSRSRASAGETISYGIFGVRTYARLPMGPLQANGVSQAISWHRPMRVRGREPDC